MNYIYIVVLLLESIVIHTLRDGHGLAAKDRFKAVIPFMMDFPVPISSCSSHLHIVMVYSIHRMAYNTKNKLDEIIFLFVESFPFFIPNGAFYWTSQRKCTYISSDPVGLGPWGTPHILPWKKNNENSTGSVIWSSLDQQSYLKAGA